MGRYVIGIDYGTLSGRASLVDTADGRTLASSVYVYPHAVMDAVLPDGTPLPPDWALQHPQDYLDVLDHAIPAVLRESGVRPEDVVGIALDVTACTALPVRRDGTPLCFLDAYKGNPHAYVKLWKHHAAQDRASIMTRIAQERGEPWLAAYGGKVSSEWSFPKLWQVLDEAPEVYAAMDAWAEAADWIVWQLCGRWVQNSCAAGYKCFCRKGEGFPDEEYFAAVDARLRHVVREKLWAPVMPGHCRAGGLTQAMAERLGLMPGIAVAAGNVDAHVAVPAAGITEPGTLLSIIGTSTCHMTLGASRCDVPGICGAVEDGIVPGFWGYESGQSCVGDHYAWMTDRFVPGEYHKAAAERGMSVHAYLTELASRLLPGESGLLALDWWNGNRSILVDVDLTGMILGMTLRTVPEEIYRALIEATAYGMRMIVENYNRHGVPLERVCALGGISQKNALAMQIYADVLNMPVHVMDCEQGGALGSAIFASVAAGVHPDMRTATEAMSAPVLRAYEPDAHSAEIYDALYAEYSRLHDYFGRGENDVMKRLKAHRGAAVAAKNGGARP
ncbi:MAG: ribulokinase [Clostridia bacterium]|nr:ribulokinase [Clostridia bacterium]